MRLIWTAEDIIRAARGRSLHEQTWVAHGISIDSRTVTAGDLFIALQGPTHDGHDHVAAAIQAGAVAALVARQPAQVPPQTPLVFVEDTFAALQDLGRAGRDRAAASILAVTGSVGKTGTKDMLRTMLQATGDTYANAGSLNNHWGVPLSLARLPTDARYGVFEMGMNHAGELGPLSRAVRPHVAMITTIESVHSEHFASLDAIADAKAEIFEGMESNATVILNRDNAYYARLAAAAKAQGIKKILSFGHHPKADARILKWSPTATGSSVTAILNDRAIHYQIGAAGEHLAMNALGALLAASAAGSDIEACAAALAHFHAPTGRGAILSTTLPKHEKGDGTITIIDESYNASPVAVRAAIAVLRDRPVATKGRRILVLGDMKELGEDSVALHRDLAEPILAAKLDLIFCCGPLMRHLYEALPPALQGGYAPDSPSLTPLIVNALHAGDVVTIKGSHSMGMDKLVKSLLQR